MFIQIDNITEEQLSTVNYWLKQYKRKHKRYQIDALTIEDIKQVVITKNAVHIILNKEIFENELIKTDHIVLFFKFIFEN